MRAIVVFLAACSAPPAPATTPAVEPAPKRDLAVAEPPPKPPSSAGTEPTSPIERNAWMRRGTRGETYEEPIRRRIPLPQEIDVAEHDLWSPCVRDFVQAQPDHVRRALRAAFARYGVTCHANKRVVIEPPNDYRGKSYIAFRGTLATDGRNIGLDFAVCGTLTSSDGGVAINYDGKRWRGITTASEQSGSCTIVSVPELPSLRRVLRDVIDARQAIVQIDVHEIQITDDIKRDLRLMLDALEALSAR